MDMTIITGTIGLVTPIIVLLNNIHKVYDRGMNYR